MATIKVALNVDGQSCIKRASERCSEQTDTALVI